MIDSQEISIEGLNLIAMVHSPVAELIVGPEGQVTWANAAAESLLGCARESALGVALADLIDWEPSPPAAAHEAQRSESWPGSTERRRGTSKRRSGSPSTLEVRLSPLALRGGVYTLVTVSDITEQVEQAKQMALLQAQIHSINRLESAQFLAGGILHDFNNILTAISGHAEVVALQDEPEERRETLESIIYAARRGASLIRRLRGVPSEVLRVGTRVAEPLPYASITSEALALLRGALPKNILLDWSLDPKTPQVPSAETELHQVVMNLGMNAAEAMMPAGGRLCVTLNPESLAPEQAAIHPAARAGIYAKLTVRDDGCGMDEGTLRQAFVPFFSTKTQLRSSGLGLAVVHEIVTRSKGFLTVKSKVGEGTQICVYLPAAPQGA